jgi:hypothetical protein
MKTIKIKDIEIGDSKKLDDFYFELSEVEGKFRKDIESMKKNINDDFQAERKKVMIEKINLIENDNSTLFSKIEEMNTAFQKTIEIKE